MKNLLLITVFFLGGCTCDNSSKKKNPQKVDKGQDEFPQLDKKEIQWDKHQTPARQRPKAGGSNIKHQTSNNKYPGKIKNNEQPTKKQNQRTNNSLSVEIQTFQTEKGWGYDVFVDGKKYIHQEIIPAVPGTKGFDTEENAQKVADLVSHKISNNIMPPSVTPEELDSLGIEY